MLGLEIQRRRETVNAKFLLIIIKSKTAIFAGVGARFKPKTFKGMWGMDVGNNTFSSFFNTVFPAYLLFVVCFR